MKSWTAVVQQKAMACTILFVCVFLCVRNVHQIYNQSNVFATLSLQQMSPIVLVAAGVSRETQLHILTAHEVIRALTCTLVRTRTIDCNFCLSPLTLARSLVLSLLPFVLDRMLLILLTLALAFSLRHSLPRALSLSLSLSFHPLLLPKPPLPPLT